MPRAVIGMPYIDQRCLRGMRLAAFCMLHTSRPRSLPRIKIGLGPPFGYARSDAVNAASTNFGFALPNQCNPFRIIIHSQMQNASINRHRYLVIQVCPHFPKP